MKFKSIEEEADHIYSTSVHYSKPYNESHYYNMWDKALQYCNGKVIDLGCGPGQVAEMICLKGYKPIKKYIGYDISKVAIDKCINKELSYLDTFKFYKQNLLENPNIEEGDCYICLEMLEHIQDDYKILNLIPKGKEVVISVPSYLGGSHVRKFNNVSQVEARYSNHIDFTDFHVIKYAGGAKIFVAAGTKI